MRTNPTQWEDMSNYLVHITRGDDGDGDYDRAIGICYSQVLEAGNFGIGRKHAPEEVSQMAVCFSEIPPGQWSRLAERRGSEYGIAFTKEFLVSRGVGPIWYARKDTPHYVAFQELMESAVGDVDSPVWKLTPMVDAPGPAGRGVYEFEWEREWRVLGNLEFNSEDVAFLILPERNHEAARGFFANAEHENVGPNYPCPFVDAKWSRERILETLSSPQ